jgi:hypothetical protein
MIITACCALNNYIMKSDNMDEFTVSYLEQDDDALDADDVAEQDASQREDRHSISDADRAAGSRLRDSIANAMWNDYLAKRAAAANN